MKKIVTIGIILTNFIYGSLWADPAVDLKNRLDKINSFHATFVQRVMDSNGNIMQESHGDLWVKRPNLFNLHMNKPDESILISDGKTLWFYNPYIEQATATWLKDTSSNMPFVLIAGNETNNWKQFNIKQIADKFELTPKSDNSNLNQFTINVSNSGVINKLCTIEQDGQLSSYQITFHKNGSIDESKFTFTPPQGVTVDDQRNK